MPMTNTSFIASSLATSTSCVESVVTMNARARSAGQTMGARGETPTMCSRLWVTPSSALTIASLR